jgi:hypothetical protein
VVVTVVVPAVVIMVVMLAVLKHHESDTFNLMAGNVDDIPLGPEEIIVQRTMKIELCLLGVTLNEPNMSAFPVAGNNHISR